MTRSVAASKLTPWQRMLAALLMLMQVLYPALAASQTVIRPDGRTQTTVANSGLVYSVSTATVTGSNAFNSFNAFSVGAGNTVNLHVPTSAINLINIVRDQRTDVYGILNAIKDGRIGGNVWFANPHGFVVGASGVVNVGSLAVSTPTQRFADGFFLAPGAPDPGSVTQLIAGTAPRNSAGLISIAGKVNAIDGINLSAGTIAVAGSVYSGARFVGATPDFTDIVNVNGLASASNVIVKEGRIQIVADNDVAVSGTIGAPGATGVRGGDIVIRAGGNVELNAGANISARGNGANSAGGTVNIRGDNNATFKPGAVIDASAGATGDGGTIELSANNAVELAGGEFRADAAGGKAGSVLIDPTAVTVSADFYSGGADYNIIADDSITVNSGVVLSTRNVVGGATADQDSAASAGASGSLSLQASSITLASGSKLLAHANGGFAAGDITLSASHTWTGEAKISVDGATLKGNNIALTASSTYDESLLGSWLPVTVPVVVAKVDINSSRIEASGNLTASANSVIDTATSSLSPLGSITAVSDASLNVGGASVIVSTGDSKLNASSKVTAKAAPGGPNIGTLPGDAGAALNVVVSTATAHLGGTSTVNAGGALEVTARNAVTATTKADASAGGAVAVGGTVALSEVTTTTKAFIDGAAETQSGSFKVAAESVNIVVTYAKAATKGATKQTPAQKAAQPSESEKTLAKYKDQASTAEGSVDVAAAVAVANVNSLTQAYVASSKTQTSTGAAVISSKAGNTSSVVADGSTAGGDVGVGAAVGLNIGVLTNLALVAENSKLNTQGLTVGAVLPSGMSNGFNTTTTSGAGAANVGVAGSLAVNAVVSTTVASIAGTAEADAGSGDVLIEATSATTSTVKSAAAVTGTGGTAKVGVGATVGMNVAVNTTVAELADGAILTHGDDLAINAKGEHSMSTDVTGGASGAAVAVTPVAAVSIGVNTTTARAGSGPALGITGAYSSVAEQTGTTTSTATGQTQGNDVAVGASVALTVATDTVSASVERDIDATKGVSVDAKSVATSSASATAGVKGGEKAKDDGTPPAASDGGAGKSVDQKITAQGDAAKAVGKKTAAAAPTTPAAGTGAAGSTAKLDETKPAPKTEDTTQAGGVSVAAAVGVNVGIATTTASIAAGKKIGSSAGALKVASQAQTDASAKADGSQVDSGNTDVGVGAAVALNVGVATNVASIGAGTDIDTQGVTVSAVIPSGQTSDYGADAKSGAGAGNVGVAGSLAVNAVVNTTVASIAGTANVDAGTGDVLIEATTATASTVKSGATVTGTGGTAKVGVGATVAFDVAVNTTVAELADGAILTHGDDLSITAKGEHTTRADATGGAAGAGIAITPVAAVALGINTTTARAGSGTALGITGAYSGAAEQTSTTTSVATGQTQGNDVAVGASVALTVATDTVTASVERDIDATTGVSVEATSTAKSSASATAGVKGGQKADAAGNAPAGPGGAPGKTVDQQVTAQGEAGNKAGAAADAGAGSKLAATKAPPKAEVADSSGGGGGGGGGDGGAVSVAAAVGVNVGVATTTASIAKGRTITSAGAVNVGSKAQTDASAKADGSQVDGGNTDVGVGAAVALNVGVATNVAAIGDNSHLTANGVTVSAVSPLTEKNDFGADAKSGAGAGNVGVAGSLALNAVANTTMASIEGDRDGSLVGAEVDAGSGDVLIEARNATASTVKAGSTVVGTGDAAKVGVGASVGLNVAANTTVAEIGDNAKLTGGDDLSLIAKADHAMSTTVTGGVAGAKVSVTPVAAVSIGVNTTLARAGESATALGLSGKLSAHADQTDTVRTQATGRAQGDVAVGASLAATVAVETVAATVERDVGSSTAIDVGASSASSARTAAVAGAKGAKAAKKDADGKETPETGTTVDEQKKNQLDFAKSRNEKTAALDTDSKTPAAETPEVNKNDTTEINKDSPPRKPTNPPSTNDKKEGSKKVSVAAAIGVDVVVNQATATIGGAGRSVRTTGTMDVKATTETNYETMATGEAVSDNIGIAAAVALTGTFNKTLANIAAGTTVLQAGDIDVIATANQNRDPAFNLDLAAEAVSGASGGDVAVAGSLAVVGNYNQTRASIDEDATIGTGLAPVGNITVKADETSKLAARARAGALSTGKESKAGVGASFAAILSYNKTTAAADYDTAMADAASSIYANSLTVAAAKHRVEFASPLDGFPKSIGGVQTWVKSFDFDALDPLNYLGSNNYYTEAVAGAAAKGAAAVAGAFAVNLFMNTTEAYLGQNVHLTTSGRQAGTHAENLGVEVAASSATKAIAFAGAVAGAKKAGVGISNTDIVNFDETNASIGAGSVVKVGAGDTADNGVKLTADASQVVANVSVSGGVGTASTGVGGVLGINLSMNKAEASIGQGAQVQAEGNVTVAATNDSTLVMIAGGVGGGKEVGVGGAIGINGVWNRTLASIARDAAVDAKKTVAVTADADETVVSAVVAGAGGGKVGVAAALSLNVIVADTEASVGEGAKLNVGTGFEDAEKVAITAHDDTVLVGVAGGGAGGANAGVGAALDTDVVVKTVKAFIADDTVDDGKLATVKADREVKIDATSTESLISVAAGFAGSGKVGVGGSVAVAVVANDVQASVGKAAVVDSDGNVLIDAGDDTTAVLTAVAGAAGGTAGVGASLAVATMVGQTRARIGEGATVNARGLGDAASVYSGAPGKQKEYAKGLAVTAYNTENVITTDISGGVGSNAGVGASVSANVIANTAEASIGRSARINEINAAASAEQQVRVKAVDETVLVNTAGGVAVGSTAGVGASANIGVIAKTTKAWIGSSALVNAKQAVALGAMSSAVTVSTTAGFAGAGNAGVGASLGAVGLFDTTEAYIEDAAAAASAARVNVSAGDLTVEASDLATSTLITGGGGVGGTAGVGGAIAVSVNASKIKAKIGNYAKTNAAGTTAVHADSLENINTATVAIGAAGSAGVAGAAAIRVVVSNTEAGIGDHAQVNQDAAYEAAAQKVDVKASDRIITVGAGGVGAGGGAAGVGGVGDVTVVLNTTSAYIGSQAEVSAVTDVTVDASSEKYVNSATFAGAGGGSAGVAGGIAIISVGSLLDGEAKNGLSQKDADGKPTATTQQQADELTTTSSVGDLLGNSAQSQETKGLLDAKAKNMAVGGHVDRGAPIDFKNTQAFIGDAAVVKAGDNVTVSARDSTLAILATGAGAGGAAAGVAGTLGVVLVHDSAEAFIASNARVDAGETVTVAAQTSENVFNVGITGAGAGAAAVNGSIVVNVVSSDTAAYIGAAEINKDAVMDAASADQSVAVSADSSSNIVTVAGSGGGAGAAAVGAVLNVNVLKKTTKAYIGEGAKVAADQNVDVVARSAENVVGAGVSIRGAGAAAVGAVVSTNVIANTTEAFIGSARDDASKSAASVESDGNVTVSAVDDSLVIALAVVGNGAGAAGVGAAVGANVISSQTRAYVGENSKVDARGNAAGTAVYSGTIADATVAEKPPAPPKDHDGKSVSGDIDFDLDGKKDGSVANGIELTAKAKSDDGSSTQSTIDPGAAKDADGNPIAGASGGLGAKGTQTVKGLSIVAMNNEKVITATLGVAGAGAAAVTGAATANVIGSVTEAGIGDGAKINESGATANSAVRVRAIDNTFMVQAGGTVAGAGAAAVSGTANTGIVTKTTTARIGDADVNASSIEVAAAAGEKIFTLTANVSIAGAAGVGAGLGVDVIANQTSASIGAGANLDAIDDIGVTAQQNSLLNVNTFAVAGGIAGVGGAFSVGVIANKTKAYVEGSDDLAERTTLNSGGNTAISAVAEENMVTATVSGAGGVAGVTGAFAVKVVKSDTDAYIGKNSRVTAGDVEVNAADTIRVVGVGGAATGGVVGVGATLDVDVVANTTAAHIDGGASVEAVHDVKVAAVSDKLVNSTSFAGSGGAVGVAGAVSIVSIGSLLDGEAKSGLNGDDTGSLVDGRVKEDKVSTQLGSSEHVQDVKTDVSGRTATLGIGGDLKGTTPPPLKNTMAFIDGGAQVKAGDNVTVTAADKTLAVISAGAGAVGAFAGVAGTVGVVLLHDSAEAYVADGAEVDAGKAITVAAATGETVVNTGITGSGAAGVAAGGSVAVNVVTSDTAAYIGDADINRNSVRNADQSVAVTADSVSNIFTVAGAGGVAGGASIGGVINVNALKKNTKAYIASGADVAAGKNVDVIARSSENVAGAGVTLRGAGLGAAGAVISANGVDNSTEAFIDDAVVDSDGNVTLSAVDDTLVVAVSAVANGAGGLGVGLNVGANVIANQTRAYVAGPAEINARGNAAGSDVYTGAISATPGALPALPAGRSGSADIDRDGTSDGSISGGASFNVGGKTVDPAAAKGSDGNAIAGASGGLGAKGEETVKGLSVVAINNEKMITATVGVAVAGGRAQTGASTANVIGSVTEASIGDGAKINQSGAAGADPSVRVRAADNTLMVQVGGTFAGAGATGLSGAIDSGIVTKQTYARIGDADVKASDVEVTADSSEDVYNVTVNAALAGGLAVGGAAGVDVIRNKTFAGIGAGADIDATADIRVNAKQHSAIDLYTVSGSAAGLVGVSGAVSVGVIANETKAYVEGSATNAASLDAAGITAVVADSNENISSVTVSGAAGGLAGVAGAVGVKVVESKTEAFVGDHTRVNQGSGGAAQDVVVGATDAVTLRGGGGTVAFAGYAGVGATAEINIVRNTTTAYIGAAAVVDADHDISVSATSTKDVQSAAIAASGGLSVGIGGAVSVVAIGAKLDDDSQGGLRDPSGGGNTATSVDGQISKDQVSGQLGGSEHVQGMKTDVSDGIGSLGVAAQMNESSAASLDKTRAYIGDGGKVTAAGDVTVAATDKVKVDIKVAGAAVGFAGIGGALGVGVVNSATEAFVGASAQVEAGDELSVAARSQSLDADGSKVAAVAGAGGIIGLGAAVAVMNNSSSTQATIGSGSMLTGAATVSAATDTKQSASASGIAVGVVAVGASIASVVSATDTRATLGSNVTLTGDSLALRASGTDDNFATATAGSGGLIAGAAAAANTTSTSNTLASVGAGDSSHQIDVGSFAVDATHTNRFNGEVDSVNASVAGASGAYASHSVTSTVLAETADDARVAANHVEIKAENKVEKDWLGANGDDARWNVRAGSGGIIGAPAGKSESHITQNTTARVGDTAQIHVLAPTVGEGSFNMDAFNEITVRDKAKLDSGGVLAVAKASSLTYVDQANATVSFGGNSSVISDFGDINAGARAKVDIEARAAADTYGLAGAPDGSAHAKFVGNNQAMVNNGAKLLADDGAINLAGGQSSSGEATRIDARATVNLWNKTAIPIPTAPDARTTVVDNASVSILGSSMLEAADDISLSADKGTVNATATGIGKDIYRETAAAIASGISELFGGGAVSFDVHGGTTSVTGAANVQVDGSLLTGLHRSASLDLNAQLIDASGNSVLTPHYQYFDANGNQVASAVAGGTAKVLWKLVPTMVGKIGYSVTPGEAGTGIIDRINLLQRLVAQYYGDTVAVNAYKAEIDFLQFQLVQLGLAKMVAGKLVLGSFNGPSAKQREAANITLNAGSALTDQTLVTGDPANAGASSTVSTVLSDYGTAATNNTAIKTDLLALSLKNTADTRYIELTSKIDDAATLTDAGNAVSISSLQAQINTQNTGYQAQIAVKSAEIKALSNKTGRTAADLDTISHDSTDISDLLGKIADNNSALQTKTQQLHDDLATIATRQGELKVAWAATSGSDKAADDLLVTGITNKIGNNTTPIGAIGTAVTTLQNNFAKFDPAVDTSYTAQAASLSNQYPTLSDGAPKGPSADFVRVNDVTARLGNIRVKGDNLTGGGQLKAPGDAQIRITNNTPDFLMLGNLTVDNSSGGQVTLNDIPVNNVSDINRINKSGGGAGFASIQTRDNQGAGLPQIIVESNYNPANYDPNGQTNIPGLAPSIDFKGDVSNTLGLVKVHSKAGSIYVDGNIRAAAVDIKADNGDFVQSYVDGFDHIAGDPANNTQGQHSATAAGPGIVSNGSVFISARYLNINGTVQSGIDAYDLTLPSGEATLTGTAATLGVTQATVDAYRQRYLNYLSYPQLLADYNAKLAVYNVMLNIYNVFHTLIPGMTPPVAPVAPDATVVSQITTFANDRAGSVTYDAGLNRLTVTEQFARDDYAYAKTAGRNTDGLYSLLAQGSDNIGAGYDPANNRYVVDAAAVKGGYIQLYGQIINTCTMGSGCGSPGTLKVLDGFGQIKITNPRDVPVALGNLDAGADPTGTGRGTAGKIDITDIQGLDGSNNATAIHSVITRNAGSVMLDQSTVLMKSDGSVVTTPTYSGPANGSSGTVTSQTTDSRNAQYSPQAGLRYVWTNAVSSKSETDWVYTGVTLLGISSTNVPTGATVVSQSGPFVTSNKRLDDGTYLQKDLSKTGTVIVDTPNAPITLSKTFVKTKEWSDCNWWTLCILQNTYSAWTETQGNLTVTPYSLKADNPIKIQFIGSDSGMVTVNSKSSVIVDGDINNKAGTTTITAGVNPGTNAALVRADQSILQGGSGGLITAKVMNLQASGGIGAVDLATQIATPLQIALGGVLNARAAHGDVVVNQGNGDLKIGTITAAGDALDGIGRVVLSAEGNIDAASTGSLLQGNRIDLTSENGTIGSLADPLKIEVGFAEDVAQRRYYGLTAAARGDIGIESRAWSGNLAGNLLVNTVVSAGGDVKLVAPGRIIDNNPIEQVDMRTWNQLMNFWDSMALRAGTVLSPNAANLAKQAQTLLSFENGKTLEYTLYWQMRQRQNNGGTAYDPGFVYAVTSAERAALLASKMSAAEIAQFETDRTAQYHQLNASAGAYNGGVYAAGFKYAASTTETADILKGSSWTERELGISVSPGMLKDITNTNPVVKSANVQGRNVTLSAGVAIGETQAAVSVPYDVDPSCSSGPNCLTDAMKVALAAAERSDVVNNSSARTIDVLRRKPVNFDAVSGLSAVVAAAPSAGTDNGNAFLASLGDARLDSVQARGEARIKVRGSIVNVSDLSPAVHTGNLVLEAANGGIGFVPDSGSGPTLRPLRIDLNSGATLIARAAENVDIDETTGDMNVDTVFSVKDIKLAAQGSILDAHAPLIPPANIVRESELNVLGENVKLAATTGSIGTMSNPLDVGVNPDGRIQAAAGPGKPVYLNGPAGRSFNIGSVLSGDAIGLAADLDMLIDGAVSGPGAISLVSGGLMTLTPKADVHATTLGVFLRAGALTMQDANRMKDGKYSAGDAARIRVDVGSIDLETVGDALITGIETGNTTDSAIRVVSTAGRILDNGDTQLDIIADQGNAKLTLAGAKGIGDDPLEVRLVNLQATSGGVVDLAAQGPLNIVGITAGDRVLLSADGDITGNSVTSTGTGGTNPDQSISIISATGGVALATVSGQADVRIGAQTGVGITTLVSGGSVSAGSTAGNVVIGTTSAGQNATFSAAAGSVTASTTTTGGTFTASAARDVSLGNVAAGGNVTLSAAGSVTADTLNVGSNLQLAGATVSASVNGGAGLVGGSVTGFGGGMANEVNLVLSGAGGFSLDSFLATNATVDNPLGSLSIGNAIIGDRATFANPQTLLLVDQHDKSLQPADIQLYTAGGPFSLYLSGNHLTTEATVIYNSPLHEISSASGPSISAVQQGKDTLTRINLPPSASAGEGEGDGRPRGSLVSFTGTPVSTACRSDQDPGCAQ